MLSPGTLTRGDREVIVQYAELEGGLGRKAVLQMLHSFVGENNRAWVSTRGLAARLGCNKATVGRHLESLQSDGLVLVVKQSTHQGGFRTSIRSIDYGALTNLLPGELRGGVRRHVDSIRAKVGAQRAQNNESDRVRSGCAAHPEKERVGAQRDPGGCAARPAVGAPRVQNYSLNYIRTGGDAPDRSPRRSDRSPGIDAQDPPREVLETEQLVAWLESLDPRREALLRERVVSDAGGFHAETLMRHPNDPLSKTPWMMFVMQLIRRMIGIEENQPLPSTFEIAIQQSDLFASREWAVPA